MGLTELLPALGVALPILGGIVTWFVNERGKRVSEAYQRKEEKYVGLVGSLRGFVRGTDAKDAELQEEFLRHLDLSWLYCSDEVIRAAYSFLDAMAAGKVAAEAAELERLFEERQRRIGRLLLAIRKDLSDRSPLRTTTLDAKEYRALRPPR